MSQTNKLKRASHRGCWILIIAALLAGPMACGQDTGSDTQAIHWTQVQWGEYYARKRNCFTCHQSDSPADGVLSGQAYPRPGTRTYGPNLTQDDSGLRGWQDEDIIRAMREGIDDGGQELCPIMPRFVDMGQTEAEALVLYLRSLPPVSHSIPDSVCPPLKNG